MARFAKVQVLALPTGPLRTIHFHLLADVRVCPTGGSEHAFSFDRVFGAEDSQVEIW